MLIRAVIAGLASGGRTAPIAWSRAAFDFVFAGLFLLLSRDLAARAA